MAPEALVMWPGPLLHPVNDRRNFACLHTVVTIVGMGLASRALGFWTVKASPPESSGRCALLLKRYQIFDFVIALLCGLLMAGQFGARAPKGAW